MIANRKALIVVAAFVLMAIGLPWGGNVPAAFAQISVTAADPPTGEQGALNLNVIIKGKGFKNGAKAKFYKTGTTDPAGVNVKSTQFVSSTQLIANVDIADGAALSLFDIEVRNADGRTGKGTELFSVLEKTISPCTLPDPVPLPSAQISGEPGYPAYLDATFGGGTGRVIAPRSMFYSGAGDGVSVDRNGRIVAVGYGYDPCQTPGGVPVWAVARYLPDGRLDPGFGAGGLVFRAFGSKNAKLSAVATDTEGRVVVAGYAPNKRGQLPAVARYTANGAPDVSFAGTGLLLLPDSKSTGAIRAIAIQSDGKIILLGRAEGVSSVFRLNEDGSLDTGFNGSGQYLDSSLGGVHDVITQWVGGYEQIVVAGGTAWDEVPGNRAAVLRLSHAGALVGTSVVNTDVDSFFTALAVNSTTNRLFAAGYIAHEVTEGRELLVAAFNESGIPVATFGDGGVVIPVRHKPFEAAIGIAVQADGCIVVGGQSNDCAGACGPDTGGGMDYATLWRFKPDGTLDETFGSNGWISDGITGERPWWLSDPTKTVRPDHLPLGMAMQTDGKVIWAAALSFSFAGVPGPNYMALARFWQ